jgi:hypothetical protein
LAYCANCGSEVSSAFCANCGTQSPIRKRKFSFSKKTLAIVAGSVALSLLAGGLLLREYVLPFSGPLEVVVTNKSSGDNTITKARLSMTLTGEELALPFVAGQSATIETTWKSHVPITLNIDSKFVEEESTSLVFAVRKSGFTGSFGGTPMQLNIKINNSEIVAELVGKKDAGETFASVVFDRANFKQSVEKCVERSMADSGEDIESAQAIYEDYESAVAAARLDGERSLYYTEWAYRADNLQGRISKIAQRFDGLSLPRNENIAARVAEVSTQLFELEQAWASLERVARQEDDDAWGGAWDQVYAADAGLSLAVDALGTIAADVRADCSDSLLRK